MVWAAVGPTGGDVSELALEEQFSELLEHYRGERGALVPLLQGAQAIFGWLPKEVMARVAEAAGEPLSKTLGVATFYSQFRLKPHAKNTIRCCHGTACHVSGAPLISQEVERCLGIHAGENTEDMLFTVEEVHCVGACGMAPVVMINDRAHGKLTPDKAVAVVKEFRQAELAAAGLDGGNGGGPGETEAGGAGPADAEESEEGAA
jgi:NADH-quinone oxidoreductase subunit E